MPHFYLSEVLSAGRAVSLPDNVIRHLYVLCLKLDEEIVLFNDDGKACPAHLGVLEKRHATVEILHEEETDNESPLNIMLVQAVSNGERMNSTLQRNAELGVDEIRPVLNERCIIRLDGERAAKRVTRWQGIVISAYRQSSRNTVPQVLPLVSYQEALRQVPSKKTELLMNVRNAQELDRITPSPNGLIFMVDPEGGQTESKEQQTFGAGFQAVTLGPHASRMETASLTVIAAVQALWGDFV